MRLLILILISSAAYGQCGSAGQLILNPISGQFDCTGVAGAGTGTVTSIGLTGTANEITVTGASPITTSGSWALSFPTGGVTLPGITKIGATGLSSADGLHVIDPTLGAENLAEGNLPMGTTKWFVDNTGFTINTGSVSYTNGVGGGGAYCGGTDCDEMFQSIADMAISFSDYGLYTFSYTISGLTGSGNLSCFISPDFTAVEQVAIPLVAGAGSVQFTYKPNAGYFDFMCHSTGAATITFSALSVTGYLPANVYAQDIFARRIQFIGPADNLSIGLDALENLTSGLANSAVGIDALYANTTGSENTAIGKNSLAGNTTGSRNVAIGLSAGAAYGTGDNNVSIGQTAGYIFTSGSDNVFVGRAADAAAATARSNSSGA